MKIGMLAPIAWRTPPRGYGPWEQVVANLTEGLVQRGHDVTLFASGDSATSAKLHAIAPHPWERDDELDPAVWRLMHIAEAFEHADEFDLIHNHFDYPPLTYSRLTSTPVLTTIHSFSSPDILPAYEKYNANTYYVSISDADRHPKLDYAGTVYNGIDLSDFTFNVRGGEPLVWLGRICYEKGTAEAIDIAERSGRKLILAGIVQEEDYFHERVEPRIDGERIQFIGQVGPAERDRLLGGAAAVLHPVMKPERFGLIMPEAMACGTPVIAFDSGSPREVVAGDETGFVVADVEQAADAVGRLDRIDRSACRRRVEERFTRDAMVERYVEVYGKVLSAHRACAAA